MEPHARVTGLDLPKRTFTEPSVSSSATRRPAPTSDAAARLARLLGDYGVFGFVLVALAALIGLPLIFVVASAVLVDPLNATAGVDLTTIRSVYTSATIWHSAWQTLLLSVVVGVIATSIGGILAWTLTRFRIPKAAMLETLVVLPLFLSPLVGAMAWITLAAPRSGLLNDILNIMNAPSWLRFDITSIGGIAFMMTLHYIPYGYLFLSSALRNTDASFEDASYLCGAGVSGTALKVLVPLLRASVLSSILFITILAAGEFSVPSILGAHTSFRPLSVHIYDAVYGFPQDYTRAAAIGTMLIAFSLTALYFYRRSLAESRRLITVTSRGFTTRRIDPGRWRGPTLSLLGLYLALTVALPYLALLFVCLTRFRTGDLATTEFTLANFRQVLGHPAVSSALVHTMVISLLVPALCVFVAVILVYGQERLKLALANLAAYVATAPIAISGIVFGTGVFVVFIHTPAYATIWLIVLALFAHYLAHAVRISGNGISQIDSSLEEAARVNGASSAKALTSILVPLLRPSLFSAFVLIYVFSVREVNTAILLYSPSSLILSVLSWNYLSDGSLAQAAVVGLIQTGLMLAGMIVARVLFGISSTRSVM